MTNNYNCQVYRLTSPRQRCLILPLGRRVCAVLFTILEKRLIQPCGKLPTLVVGDFQKFSLIFNLRALVRRFLVGYVICVREESRLLYSDRLQVYGKDRSYTTEHFHDLLSDFKVSVFFLLYFMY